MAGDHRRKRNVRTDPSKCVRYRRELVHSRGRTKKVEEDASETHVDYDVYGEYRNRCFGFNAKVATDVLRAHVNDRADVAVDGDWDEHEDDQRETCEVDFVMLSPHEWCSYNVDALHEKQEDGSLGKSIERKAHPRTDQTELVSCEALACYKHCGCEYECQY